MKVHDLSYLSKLPTEEIIPAIMKEMFHIMIELDTYFSDIKPFSELLKDEEEQ